jgi:hypothetical protein
MQQCPRGCVLGARGWDGEPEAEHLTCEGLQLSDEPLHVSACEWPSLQVGRDGVVGGGGCLREPRHLTLPDSQRVQRIEPWSSRFHNSRHRQHYSR